MSGVVDPCEGSASSCSDWLGVDIADAMTVRQCILDPRFPAGGQYPLLACRLGKPEGLETLTYESKTTFLQ